MAYGGRSWRGRWAWPSAVLLLGATAMPGCKGESTTHGSGGSGATGGGSGPPTTQTFGEQLAAAYCGALGPCCKREGFAFSGSSCSLTIKSLMDAEVSVYAAYPGIVFDEAAAADCIDVLTARATACTDRELDANDDSCSKLFVGTVPEGGTCSMTEECADIPGVGPAECNAGVCKRSSDVLAGAETHAALGGPCAATCRGDEFGYGCAGPVTQGNQTPASPDGCWEEDGLYCTRDFVCAALPAVGQACAEYRCAQDGYCDTSSSRCVPRVVTGPCPNGDECATTSVCNGAGTCEPRRANGSACNSDVDCASENCDGDVCKEWSIANAATCQGLFG